MSPFVGSEQSQVPFRVYRECLHHSDLSTKAAPGRAAFVLGPLILAPGDGLRLVRYTIRVSQERTQRIDHPLSPVTGESDPSPLA